MLEAGKLPASGVGLGVCDGRFNGQSSDDAEIQDYIIWTLQYMS